MSNKDHLEIVKQGAVLWNQWRAKNPFTTPDLADADLSKANLSGVNLGSIKGRAGFRVGKGILIPDLDPGTPSTLDPTSFLRVDFNPESTIETFAFFTGIVGSGAANLRGTNLTNADLIGADLVGANLADAILTNANIGWTRFGDNDLSTVKGLDTVHHHGPSIIGIETIYLSKGNIPEAFLRGAGVPENLITYMRSLTENALSFYSCFISYAEPNDLFSERLYDDLQSAGVRCWRWKEDAKWGRTLMKSIDEAVWFYDKLVVICSEQSLKSPAVIREIERALQKEDDLARQGRESEVLFPIRLDDYIFSGWTHHRKPDVIYANQE